MKTARNISKIRRTDPRAEVLHELALRKTAEVALVKSEDRFRELYNKTPVMYFTLSAQGQTLDVNEFGAHQLEYEPDELIGKPVVNIFFEPDRESALNNVKHCLDSPGKVFEWELRKIKKLGSVIWVKETAWAVKDANGQDVVLIVCQDITESRQNAELLKKSEQQFRKVFELSPVGIAIVDANGDIVDLNSALSQIYGETKDYYLAQRHKVRKYLRPDGSERPQSELASYRARRERQTVRNVETGILKANNQTIWTRVSAAPLDLGDGSLVVVTEDVTERYRVTETLVQSEKELADFFEEAPLGLHWVGENGIVLRVNKAELEMLGYSREEYVGHHIAEFHVDQDLIRDLLTRLLAGETIRDLPARLKSKNGTIRHVLISSRALMCKGKFIHTQCFTRDVTEKRLRKKGWLSSGARKMRASVESFMTGWVEISREFGT